MRNCEPSSFPSRRTPASVLWLGALPCAIAAGACSLIVSTSGLEGGPDRSDAGAGAGADSGSGQSDSSPPVDDAAVEAAATDPDLLGAWPFDDPADVLRDVSGHGHHGVLVSGATYTPDGARGGALLLTANGGMIVDGLAGQAFPRSGSLSLHFNHDLQGTDSDPRNVFDTWTRARRHLLVRGFTPDEFQIAGQYDSPDYVFVRNFTVQRRTWTHVVVTWNEQLARGRVYRDGALLAESSYTEPFAPDEQVFRLGGGFVGMIDEVRLYARELTPSEVAAVP